MVQSSKTLRKIFNTPEAWWKECIPRLHFASGKNNDVISAFFWETRLFDYLADDVLAGRTKITVNKILAESALDFVSIKKRDDIWRKVLPELTKLFKPEAVRTFESEKYFGKEGKTSYGKRKEDTKTAPVLGLTSDKVQGVNWGEISKTLLEGFYQDGKFNPNVENQNESGWRTNTKDTKEQKQQQIGRLIQSVLACDHSDLAPLLEKYAEKYTWRYTSPPGDVDIDFTTGTLRWIGGDYEEESEVGVDGKPKAVKRPDLEDISEEQWQAKFEAGEAVELSWDLECWQRYKRRLESTLKGKTAASQETDIRKIKALDRLTEIFSMDIFIPPLEHFDKVMNGITGFKFFKKELRDRIETSYRYKQIGEKQPQIFYCLLVKPGVGKTEICKTLAKALNRPICILSMGGASETKPLEGIDPAFKSSSWSDLLETMVEKKSEQKIFLKDCEEELKIYKARPKKTPFQEKKIKDLEEWIKKMKDDKVDFLKLDLGCKAPIILLDEAEKVKHPSVLDAMGKILDDNVNWSHYDKFLEYRINLGYCLIFVTMNWFERAPDFIRDRCKFVDIELLTYAQRQEILENRADAFTRQFFPVIDTATGKVDRERQKEHLTNKTFSPLQQQVRDLIGIKTIKNCITQTWGIRGGIMNLKKVFDLLLLIDVRGQLNDLYSLDNYDWDSDEKNGDGELLHPEEYSTKVRRLRYDDVDSEELILTKKVDYDWIAKEKGSKWQAVLHPQNQIKDWPDYNERTDWFFSPDGRETNLEEDFGDKGDKEIIKELQKEAQKLKKRLEDQAKTYEELSENQRAELEQKLEEIRQAGENKEELQRKIMELEEKLNNMEGFRPEEAEDSPHDYPYLSTVIIKDIETNGYLKYGETPFEKKIRVVKFDNEVAEHVKKITVRDCPELIQLDLTGLKNLEKLTLKNSKWDSIKGIKDCKKLQKISVKDCQDVSLEFLENSQVEQVKII